MVKRLTQEQILGRLAEYDLVDNFDSKSPQYIAWKKLYSFFPKGLISDHAQISDITKMKNSTITLLKRIEKQPCSTLTMVSKNLFSMNKKLQKQIVKHLINISKKGTVNLYLGEEINGLFDDTNVNVKIFKGENMGIIEFIKVDEEPIFMEYPHT